MQHQSTVISGPENGRTFPLRDGQTLTIGRGQARNTQINDPRMSRVHCRVTVDGGTTTLSDSGSTGGTHVGDKQIAEHELRPGESFRIGETEIRYMLAGAQEQATIGGDLAFGKPKPQPNTPRLPDLVGKR